MNAISVSRSWYFYCAPNRYTAQLSLVHGTESTTFAIFSCVFCKIWTASQTVARQLVMIWNAILHMLTKRSLPPKAFDNIFKVFLRPTYIYMRESAPDLDGGVPGAQAWWEALCADTKCLGRGWSMQSIVFPHIINIYDVILSRHICYLSCNKTFW